MKYLYSAILLALLLMACKNETNNKTHFDFTGKSNTDVLKEIVKIESEGNSAEQLIKDGINHAIKDDNETKAKDLIYNILYHFGDKKNGTVYKVSILKALKGKSFMTKYRAAIATLFLSTHGTHAYGKELKADKTITDLLESKEYEMNGDGSNKFNFVAAQEYIELSELYLLMLPKDESAANAVLKAANLARSIPGMSKKGIAMYDFILSKQPNHPKAGSMYFLKAYTIDNDLNDPEKAKPIYVYFIKNFPNDPFVKDAQILVDNLGKSDQELFDKIRNKKTN